MTESSMPFNARYVDPRVRLAMRIFEFEQTRVPSLDDVAKRVGLSPFYLSRLFTTQVGESCVAYSRRIRLENSNNQLMHDPMPLDVVAASFGYASQTAYTRAFTRHFGKPPVNFAAAVLGQTQADFAVSQLGPAGGSERNAGLPESAVRLVKHLSRPALSRRFYGHDLVEHWRTFLAELPPGLADGAQLVGMAFDSPRVTPPSRWRYDCALALPHQKQSRFGFDEVFGLDLVEIPGGLYAEVSPGGGFMEMWQTTVGLFTEWLPRHREYRTDGDPVVQWHDEPPLEATFKATATIRIYPRDGQPTLNLRPLTPHGRPAGHRTLPQPH